VDKVLDVKTFLYFSILVQGWGAVLAILTAAIYAGFHGGTVRIRFTDYNELWYEVAALTIIATVYPAALWWVLRRSRL